MTVCVQNGLVWSVLLTVVPLLYHMVQLHPASSLDASEVALQQCLWWLFVATWNPIWYVMTASRGATAAPWTTCMLPHVAEIDSQLLLRSILSRNCYWAKPSAQADCSWVRSAVIAHPHTSSLVALEAAVLTGCLCQFRVNQLCSTRFNFWYMNTFSRA